MPALVVRYVVEHKVGFSKQSLGHILTANKVIAMNWTSPEL